MQCLRKLEYYIRSLKKGYFKQKYQASEKYVNFYALNTWLGLVLHELLHQCGVVWRNPPVSGPLVFPSPQEVLRAWV